MKDGKNFCLVGEMEPVDDEIECSLRELRAKKATQEIVKRYRGLSEEGKRLFMRYVNLLPQENLDTQAPVDVFLPTD